MVRLNHSHSQGALCTECVGPPGRRPSPAWRAVLPTIAPPALSWRGQSPVGPAMPRDRAQRGGHDEHMVEELGLDELKAIEDRARAATKGPWQSFLEGRDHLNGDDFIRTGGTDEISPDMYVSFSNAGGTFPAGQGDLDFIAHARQDVPRLVSEVRRLRRALGLNTG